MQIDIRTENRVGIAQEILAVLVSEKINLSAVEVVEHHVYLQIPGLSEEALVGLAGALNEISGVFAIKKIAVMPRDGRRRQIAALLTAIPDPVIAIDQSANILMGNEAAASLLGKEGDEQEGWGGDDLLAPNHPLEKVLGSEELSGALISSGFNLSNREVALGGSPFYLECRPIEGPDDSTLPSGLSERPVIGGVLIFHSPQRIGARLSVVQGQRGAGFEAIIAVSEPMRVLIEKAKRAALTEAPVMILGATGTGKELLARACHQGTERRDEAFLALNCAALPEGLAESELFGYAPGAFTSADRGGKPGLLEMAAGGTLFLDEIGDMSPYLQTKLLRFLQDGSYRRVGGRNERRVDVRILCATHRDLEAMVKEGTFREDLYYRLNVLSLKIPPLRDRAEDILPLAQHFIVRAASQIGREDGTIRPPRLSATATARLVEAPWPGNVRQLENAIFRAVSLCERPFLEPADFDFDSGDDKKVIRNFTDGAPQNWSDAMAGYEASLLGHLYPDYPSSRKLARRLGVSHTTIAQKLKAYGIARR